jgi:hypothetical protein
MIVAINNIYWVHVPNLIYPRKEMKVNKYPVVMLVRNKTETATHLEIERTPIIINQK